LTCLNGIATAGFIITVVFVVLALIVAFISLLE